MKIVPFVNALLLSVTMLFSYFSIYTFLFVAGKQGSGVSMDNRIEHEINPYIKLNVDVECLGFALT